MKKDLNKILIEKKKNNKAREYNLWVDMFKTLYGALRKGCLEGLK